jgi:translation initiation factor IF-3
MSTQRAQELADQHELDLVEVAPSATPPVCRIIDFSKFKYDRKKEREAKHQAGSSKRTKPNIGEARCDQVKRRSAFKKMSVKINLFWGQADGQ